MADEAEGTDVNFCLELEQVEESSHEISTCMDLADDDHSTLLPAVWKKSIPLQDHAWLGKALFRLSNQGYPELRPDLHDFWYRPPAAPINEPPCEATQFFRSRFFLWAPCHNFKVVLKCPQEKCDGDKLVSCGYYSTVRKVLDFQDCYYMGTEYLQCTKCKKKVSAWHNGVLCQLNYGLRAHFPAILTYQCAVDSHVVIRLRDRSLENIAAQTYLELWKLHTHEWNNKESRYQFICMSFLRKPEFQGTSFPEPPLLDISSIPKPAWLLSVYCKDVMSRLDSIKASITSVHGRILKISSTKKVTCKLAGAALGTVASCTNVGNELSQVLVSVLTTGKDSELQDMYSGLVKRYAEAGVEPPTVLYVDGDCCSNLRSSSALTLLTAWPDLLIRLDSSHFMQCITACACSVAHPLYETFVSRLFSAIYEWDSDELAAFIRAKKAELMKKGIRCDTDSSLLPHITRKELALHCQRRTRGVEITTRLITELLEVYSSPNACGAMGRALLIKDKIGPMWQSQRQHVQCIQDPPGEVCQLYTRIGSVVKGGVKLPQYHCARGTTSLESFHLHMNEFIPGSRAGAVLFHACLLEGLQRWNHDRAQDSLPKDKRQILLCYDDSVVSDVNDQWQEFYGHPLDANFQAPRAYTGELLGVEYLYHQGGAVMPTLNNDDPDARDDDTHVDDSEMTEDLGEDLELMELEEFSGPMASVLDVEVLPTTRSVPLLSLTSTISGGSSMIQPKSRAVQGSKATIFTGNTSVATVEEPGSGLKKGRKMKAKDLNSSLGQTVRKRQSNLPAAASYAAVSPISTIAAIGSAAASHISSVAAVGSNTSTAGPAGSAAGSNTSTAGSAAGSHTATAGSAAGSHTATAGSAAGSHTATAGSAAGSHTATAGSATGSHTATAGSAAGSHTATAGSAAGSHTATAGSAAGSHTATAGSATGSHTATAGSAAGSHTATAGSAAGSHTATAGSAAASHISISADGSAPAGTASHYSFIAAAASAASAVAAGLVAGGYTTSASISVTTRTAGSSTHYHFVDAAAAQDFASAINVAHPPPPS